MNAENIYSSMDANEIASLIESSPSNLLDFFEDSMYIQDKNVASFGKLRVNPITYHTTINKEIMSDHLKMIELVDEDEAQPIEFRSTKF